MNCVAIIPARIGSKRIPRKNIKIFNGKPVILNTIDVLKKSKLFKKILISTDSKKIREICKKKNVSIPFLRPKKISGDKATTADVVKHAINFLDTKKFNYDFICCVYPPNPFLRNKDLIKGFKKVKSNNYSFVFSATILEHSALRSFSFKKKKLTLSFPANTKKRSQDLHQLFCDAAQFYWGHKNSWLKYKHVFQKNSSIVEIPNHRFCDIDNLQDWKKAEFLFKFHNLGT